MKIHTNTWHYKVFNYLNNWPVEYYENTTDCAYVRKILLTLILGVLAVVILVPLSLVFVAMVLEPPLTIGAWLFGFGFEPFIGQYVPNKEGDTYGLMVGGTIVWGAFIISFASYHFKKWTKTLTYEDAPKETLSSVVYYRFKGWKDKICHPVEFVDD